MRTKNILKKDAAAFGKDAAALITRLGFQPFPADVPGYDYHARQGLTSHPPTKPRRTKNILKKDAAAFCKDAAALLTRLGFQPFPADVPGYDCHAHDQRIQTDVGIYVVHLPSMETWHPSTLEDLNGYFQDPARAAEKVDCNPFSGKWNLLHSDPAHILRAFESRMKRIGARALLPGEMDEADAADAAKLAEYRADMEAFMAKQKEEEAP